MNIAYLPNPMEPSKCKLLDAEVGQSFNAWLDNSGWRAHMGTVAVFRNGHQVEERDWDLELADGDTWALINQPEGPAVVGWIVANWVVIAVTVAITVAATMLLTPSMPEFGNPGASTPESSPTYSINSRSNRARLGEPKPVIYGSPRVYPDLGAHAYTEYFDNEQILYQLYEVSEGEGTIDQAAMRYENTPLNDFEDFSVEVVPPGQPVTLYPRQVISHDLGLELENDQLGPYTANPVDTRATQLAFDLIAPGGLYYQTDDGKIRSITLQVRFEAQEVDALDAPVGNWFPLGDDSLTGDGTATALRQSYYFEVPPGRYQVRVTRLTTPNDSTRYADTLQWGALRAYLDADTDITSTTRVALKIRATNALPNGVVQKFNLIFKRHLPVWSSATGWSAPQWTANPAWIFADACRASYGGDRPDSRIDLLELEALAADFAAEGVEFHGVFDVRSTLWQALTKISQVGMAVPIDQGGIYRMVRDVQQGAPDGVFGMHNIVRGSFSITDTGVLDNTADGVIAEYFDAARDDRPLEVLCVLPGQAGNNPRRVKLFGVTDRDLAFRIGMLLAAQNYYRRRLITFDTGREAEACSYGSQISVSHRLFGREGAEQVDGHVLAFDNTDLLTLSVPVNQLTDPYIRLRKPDGKPTPAYDCEVVGTHQLRIIGPFDATALTFEGSREWPLFMAGDSSTFDALCKITRIQPQGRNRYRIEAFIDDPRVYTAAQGLSPPAVGALPALSNKAPVVEQLYAVVSGSAAEPEVTLSWIGRNCEAYQVEYSINGGTTWLSLNKLTSEQRLVHTPDPGTLKYRVAGTNLMRGAWVQVDVDTSVSTTAPPPPVTGLAVVGGFTGKSLEVSWSSLTSDHLVEFVKGGQVLLTKRVTATSYQLAGSQAVEHGLGRAFDVRVTSIDSNKTQSDTPVSISVSNPAPAVPNNVLIRSTVDGFSVVPDFMIGTDDVVGLLVWGDADSGFAVGAGTLLGRSDSNSFQFASDAPMYIRCAWVDSWSVDYSDLNVSGEFLAQQGQVTNDKIAELSVDKLIGNIAAWLEVNIGTAVIGTAQLKEILQSINFSDAQGAEDGWQIQKSGKAIFHDIDARGTVRGSSILGSVIDGGVFIGGTDLTVATEYDDGSSPRELCFVNGVSDTDIGLLVVNAVNSAWTGWTPVAALDIRSGAFNGEGSTTEAGVTINNNYVRYWANQVKPLVSVNWLEHNGDRYLSIPDQNLSLAIEIELMYDSTGAGNWVSLATFSTGTVTINVTTAASVSFSNGGFSGQIHCAVSQDEVSDNDGYFIRWTRRIDAVWISNVELPATTWSQLNGWRLGARARLYGDPHNTSTYSKLGQLQLTFSDNQTRYPVST